MLPPRSFVTARLSILLPVPVKSRTPTARTKRVFEDDGTFTITSGAFTLNYWKELVP